MLQVNEGTSLPIMGGDKLLSLESLCHIRMKHFRKPVFYKMAGKASNL